MKYKNILNKFRDLNILVIGDIMIDEYVWGKVSRISPEAPVPVVDITSKTYLLGGAANVMNNIHCLEANAFLSGIIGTDIQAEWFLEQLKNKNIDVSSIFQDDSRPTTIKTRIVARNQQLARMDNESRKLINDNLIDKIVNYLDKNSSKFNAVMISDYNKGVISPKLLSNIIKITDKNNIPILVDPKDTHFKYYKNVTCITPNLKEASEASGIEIIDEKTLYEAADKIMNMINCKMLLITRSADGMSLFEKGKKAIHIPTVAKKVYDVTGAGDTVISVMALSLGAGASFEEAANISNYAAGIVVGQFGTATVTIDKIIKGIEKHEI